MWYPEWFDDLWYQMPPLNQQGLSSKAFVWQVKDPRFKSHSGPGWSLLSTSYPQSRVQSPLWPKLIFTFYVLSSIPGSSLTLTQVDLYFLSPSLSPRFNTHSGPGWSLLFTSYHQSRVQASLCPGWYLSFTSYPWYQVQHPLWPRLIFTFYLLP